MSQPVWITRTPPGAGQTAQRVEALGLTPIIAPLLRITATAHSSAAPQSGEALAFTSANGLRAFASLSDNREFSIYCVGRATAEQARAMGFKTVKSADGAVDDLVALLRKDKISGLVHYSGVHVAGDLVGALRLSGVKARREIIYGTQSVDLMPEAAMAAAEQGGYVLLHSPKAAQTLLMLNTANVASRLTAISLSENIDACLAGSDFAGRHIASSPNDAALMAALEKAARRA